MVSINKKIILSERDLNVKLIEDVHRYQIGEIFADKSVTGVTEVFFDPFDSAAIIRKKISKEDYGTSDDAAYLRASWDLTASIGSAVHKLIENYFNKDEDDWNSYPLLFPAKFTKFYEPDVETTHIFTKESFNKTVNLKYETFLKHKIFLKSLEFVAAEYIIYGNVAGSLVAGTIDGLFKCDGEYCLIDWKTSDNMFISRIVQRDSPFKGKWVDKFDKYKHQLHCYQWILEKYYNVKIKLMAIVQVSDPDFKILAVEDDCICKKYYAGEYVRE